MEVVTVWLAIDRSDAATAPCRSSPAPTSAPAAYSDYDAVPDPERSVFGTEIRKGLYDASVR